MPEEGGGKEGEAKRRRPMFATGEIVGDYGLLYEYWREAGEKAADSVLSEKDFGELRRLVQEEGVSRLDMVLERLKPLFRERIDASAAARAAEKYYGTRIPESEAVDRVAGLLAGWLVEAASEWGMIKLRRGWEKRRGEVDQQEEAR